MNMRQHKRWVMARQLSQWADVFAGRRILNREPLLPLGELLMRKLALQALVEEPPEEPPTFQCVKVNGGDVVATFDTQAEALSLVLKHFRQKKAKLQVINTGSGELVLFEEPEFTLGNIAATA